MSIRDDANDDLVVGLVLLFFLEVLEDVRFFLAAEADGALAAAAAAFDEVLDGCF